MTYQQFKKETLQAFLDTGYVRHGKLLRCDGGEVSVFIGVATDYGNQGYVDVGFWLHRLGGDLPERIERSHLYARLERLVPQHRELILRAGATSEPGQVEACSEFISRIREELGQTIGFASEGWLRPVVCGNRFNGMVKKEARIHLCDPGNLSASN